MLVLPVPLDEVSPGSEKGKGRDADRRVEGEDISGLANGQLPPAINGEPNNNNNNNNKQTITFT